MNKSLKGVCRGVALFLTAMIGALLVKDGPIWGIVILSVMMFVCASFGWWDC